MPYAFALYKALKQVGLDQNQAEAIASVVEKGRAPGGDTPFKRESVVDSLFDGGLPEAICEALADPLRTCFYKDRHSCWFDRGTFKFNLVRAGMTAAKAEAILDALEPCVLSRRENTLRILIHAHPGYGKVVMCDFRHLRKPEMQKERRAIVVCSPQLTETNRCAVIPVSKSHPRSDPKYHVEFVPSSYPFFHATESVWAVCDHVYTVSFARLWKINVNKRPVLPLLKQEHLEQITRALGTNLNILR